MSEVVHGEMEHRGPKRPKGAMTFPEAHRLPGLAGKHHMKVRRALLAARIGWWTPQGRDNGKSDSKQPRRQRLYDAKHVREIAARIRGAENPRPPRQRKVRNGRPPSPLPHGGRAGWATAREILERICCEKGKARWLRQRLLALGVMSEQRILTRSIERVFPIAEALDAINRGIGMRGLAGWRATTFGRFFAPKEGFPRNSVNLAFHLLMHKELAHPLPTKLNRVSIPEPAVIVVVSRNESAKATADVRRFDDLIAEVMTGLRESAANPALMAGVVVAIAYRAGAGVSRIALPGRHLDGSWSSGY